jgi:hypothetical protein
MIKKSYLSRLIYFFIAAVLLTGCAPGPPPPPIFPGFEWLIIVIAVLAAVIIWKEYISANPRKTEHLTEALNEIHQQLKELEKKLNDIEKNQNNEKD